MKYLVFLLAIVYSLSYSLRINPINEATYGCRILEGEDTCCWQNSNGCCKPAKPHQLCPMVITYCCKQRVYDEDTKTYKYLYTKSNGKHERM